VADKRDFDEFLDKFRKHHELMKDELQKVIIGQEAVIDQILAAIFTGGHCLLVGVPGLAKTLIVSTIARILDVEFKRIQFTPDLMPSDITGTNVLDENDAGRREFRFVQGPVFTSPTKSTERRRRLRRHCCSRCRSTRSRSDNRRTTCRIRSL
jgi:MoxR-like ATPase